MLDDTKSSFDIAIEQIDALKDVYDVVFQENKQLRRLVEEQDDLLHAVHAYWAGDTKTFEEFSRMLICQNKVSETKREIGLYDEDR